MNSRNLIPAQRQAIKRGQRAVRRWLLINSTYLLVLGTIGTLCAMTMLHRDDEWNAPSPAVGAGQKLTNVRAQAREASVLKTQLQSVQEVTDRPDWSILLAAISQSLGDEVVLSAVDCTQSGNGITTNAEMPNSFRITGIGQSQNAVTRFVLAVENLHFFARVRLVQTSPQSLSSRDCVGFELVCSVHKETKAAK
jgi:hypothetical protein